MGYAEIEMNLTRRQKMRVSKVGQPRLVVDLYGGEGGLEVASIDPEVKVSSEATVLPIWDEIVKRWNRATERLTSLKRVDGVRLGDGDVHLQYDIHEVGGFETLTLVDMDDGDVIVLSEDSMSDLYVRLSKHFNKKG